MGKTLPVDGAEGRKAAPSVPTVKSVFFKCAALMAMTTIVVAGVMAFQSARLADSLARSGIVAQAGAAAQSASAALANPLRYKALPKVRQEMEAAFTAAGENVLAAVVVNGEGELVFALGDNPELGGERLVEFARSAIEKGDAVTASGGLEIASPIRLASGQTPLGAVAFVFTDEAALSGVVDEKRIIMAWAAGIFLFMMALTLALLKRSLGAPLAAIDDAISRLSDGNYETSLDMTWRGDEFGRIAGSVQTLTSRLQSARLAELERIRQMDVQVGVVRSLANGLDALADGALNHEINEGFPNEYEGLRRNFNRAMRTLRGAITNVSDNASNILRSSDEIARASDELSSRTETQAATLEQTAAALEEMLSTVKAAANRAREADHSVTLVRETAQKNGAVMQDAVSAMGTIEKSSERIVEIITVIDDIAFQTNLLALNAGVEAARAGDSGKGFAVVASEVRSLAQRSAEAAQQIKELIDASTGQIKDGVELVQRAGVALQDVVGQVETISDLIAEIAAGAGEQADGLTQINGGVGNLDRVTQQNAAMVEQTSAAAHMLREDANQLTSVVGIFNVVRGTIAATEANKPDVSSTDMDTQEMIDAA